MRVQAFDNIRFDVEKLVGMSADPSDSEESDLELDDMTILNEITLRADCWASAQVEQTN